MANNSNGVSGKRPIILRRRVKDNNGFKNINNVHPKPQRNGQMVGNPVGVSGSGHCNAQTRGLNPGNQSSRGILQDANGRATVSRKKNPFHPRKPTHRPIRRAHNESESPTQLKESLEIMLSDIHRSAESRRAVIEYLATEDGLSRVKQTVETKYSVRYSVTTPMFDPHCLLFLRVIAHKDVLKSMIVEKALGTIYNVVYGLNGSRGVSFFQHVVDCLKETLLPAEDDDQQNRHNGLWQLILVTEALLHLLTVNQAAVLRLEFKGMVNDLGALYIYHQQLATEFSSELRQTYGNINRIVDILAMGDNIKIVEPRKHSSASQQSESVVLSRVDFPGDLSDAGRRHDNDHAAIQGVRILPTLSEIYSKRSDFLPTYDACKLPSGHHREGIRRLLDTQFRLLREDTSGLLRDAVRMVIENWNIIVHGSDCAAKRKLVRQKSPTPMRIYYDAQVRHSTGSGVKGIEMEVEFDQLQRIKRLSPDRRRKHWLNSRSLREGGGLVALIDAEVEDDTHVVFLRVSNRDLDRTREVPAGVVRDVISDVDRAMVTLCFPTTPSKEDVSGLVQMTNSRGTERPLILVEFPAVQYNQFEGILRCLQELDRNPSRIPFRKWIQAGVGSLIAGQNLTELPDARSGIPPPLYLKGAMLDLSSIQVRTGDEEGDIMPLILSSRDDPRSVQRRLCQSSTLDSGQAEAMVSALTHELALIQGPPGTGKSYVGIQLAKCLLDNKERLGLGPLLCVCYTNHALDQFLGGLEASGVSRILRIGSHSPSPLMEAFSLQAYKRRGSMSKTSGQGRNIRDSKAVLNELAARITRVLTEFGQGRSFIAHAFLASRHPQYEVQIREGQSAGREQLKIWLSGNGPGDLEGNGEERPIDQLLSAGPWTLTHSERSRLEEYFYSSGKEDRLQLLEDLVQVHAREKQLHTSIFTEMDSHIFEQVDVVGVTTTGLANNSDLLRTLQAKVLICEEAGEVLESHLLTALLPSVEHAIFIGDHLQLRPKISRRHLSMESDAKGPRYNLDESLFERLAGTKLSMAGRGSAASESVTFEFPVAQLNHQRRMHPSIASLIREQLYPKLQDHPSTSLYPEVPGIKRRLFWLDHENIEDPGDPEDPMQSKTNTWEAQMVTALVAHLRRQGKYKRGEIAVLTPYVAQLKLLKEMLENVVDLIINDSDLADLGDYDVEDLAADKGRIMKGSLSDQLRMATVDNVQGEEASVVIISLVRSNRARQCGFLKTPNRINVLLSRAKHGMYIIGNAQTSCHVPMWQSVIKMLEDGSNIGRSLELQCPRHPNSKACVSSPDDFPKFAPEGGCAEKCGLRLQCGHTCTFKCHSTQFHSVVKCMEICTVMRSCGHACQKKCHEPCGDCTEVTPDVTLPCGHTAQVQCRDIEQIESLECPVSVTRQLSCGHQVQAPCSKLISSIKCSNHCGSPRPCGHACRNECWRCHESGKHGACTAPCGRQYTACVHTCKRTCHSGTCSPCRLPCEVRCVHSQCPGKCSDPCPPCAQTCGWSCIHRQHQCDLPCAVPCEIVPCNKRCEKILECGHRCPGICGERCPDSKLCHECGSKEVQERLADLVMFQKYAEIDVEGDPLVFLSCGHFFTRFTMDGVMAIKYHYEIEPTTEELIRPKLSWRAMTSFAAPTCPECRGSLRDIHRYNRITKKALLDESTRRFVVKANRDYIAILKTVQLHEEALDEHGSKLAEWLANNPFDSMVLAQVQQTIDTYSSTDGAMRNRVQKFLKKVRTTEQPLGRVNELLASAAARAGAVGGNEHATEQTGILTGFSIRGECLHLRLTWVLLWETERICKNPAVPFDTCSVLRGKVRNQLPELLEKCHAVRGQSSDGKFLAERVQATLYQVLVSQLFLNCIATEAQALRIPPALLSRNKIKESLQECESLYLTHLGTLGHLKDDIEKTKRFCDGQPFYTSVTAEERREVYEAMSVQFQGTGHWYYCRNNHPFTVGECGMPMEEARCPQCGERVGGHDHQPVAGVQQAQDMEAEFGTA